MLDDISPAGIERQRQFYTTFRDRLAREVKSGSLSPEDRADYDIVAGQISLGLLELDRIQSYRHNPTTYVELAGNALFNPQVLEYAPKAERFRHIIARLRKLPGFLDQAANNLAVRRRSGPRSPSKRTRAISGWWTKPCAPTTVRNTRGLRCRRHAGAGCAGEFQTFLQHDLARRTQADWRLGRNVQREIPVFAGDGSSPSDVLQRAEADLKAVRDRMFQLALPLHAKYYPAHKAHTELAGGSGEPRDRRDAGPHCRPALHARNLFRRRQTRPGGGSRVCAEKKLLTLPPRDQPAGDPDAGVHARHLRGGRLQSAPALEPQLGAFYWVTPIPKSWPQRRDRIQAARI